MGVPAFYRWLTKRYPKIVVDCVEDDVQVIQGVEVPVDTSAPNPNGVEFDNLYLDMNGIIHPCFHPEDKPAPTTEREVFLAIFEYIDRLFAIVRPRKLLYMAIDGVAPRAKMNQQRSRRFRAAQELEEKQEHDARVREAFALEGAPAPPPKENAVFDSNTITPGTPFMHRLSVALQYYVHQRLANDPGWRGVKVLLSDANAPGEGEHKVMAFVREQRACPDHDPTTRHCMYGLDADLIMLALATHEPRFWILREVVFQPEPATRAPPPGGGAGVEPPYAAPAADTTETKPDIARKPYQFLLVGELRRYLELDLSSGPAVQWVDPAAGGLNKERLYDDFVFMCFFVGNDFLPHMPTLDIRERAIELLIATYKRLLPELGGYLVDGADVHLDRVQRFILDVGRNEDAIFARRARMLRRDKDRRKHRDRDRGAGPGGRDLKRTKWGTRAPERGVAEAAQAIARGMTGEGRLRAARDLAPGAFDLPRGPDGLPAAPLPVVDPTLPRGAQEQELERQRATQTDSNKGAAAALRERMGAAGRKRAFGGLAKPNVAIPGLGLTQPDAAVAGDASIPAPPRNVVVTTEKIADATPAAEGVDVVAPAAREPSSESMQVDAGIGSGDGKPAATLESGTDATTAPGFDSMDARVALPGSGAETLADERADAAQAEAETEADRVKRARSGAAEAARRAAEPDANAAGGSNTPPVCVQGSVSEADSLATETEAGSKDGGAQAEVDVPPLPTNFWESLVDAGADKNGAGKDDEEPASVEQVTVRKLLAFTGGSADQAMTLYKQRLADEAREKSDMFDDMVQHEEKIRLDEPGWRLRYYKDKFKVKDEEEMRDVARGLVKSFVEGLCWVQRYYYDGVASWTWYYPYHYAPFASDMTDLASLDIGFELGEPFKPLEQLMGVLPAASAHALPVPYRHLFTAADSPLLEFYPRQFEVDMNGKRFAWQGVALLPFIEESRLLASTRPLEPRLTAEEAFRNSRRLEQLYVGGGHPLAPELCRLAEQVRRSGNPAGDQGPSAHDLDPGLSGGMMGAVLPPAGEACPAVVPAPYDLGEDITHNVVVCAAYRLPQHRVHSCSLLPGAVEEETKVTKDDVPRDQPLWHDPPQHFNGGPRAGPGGGGWHGGHAPRGMAPPTGGPQQGRQPQHYGRGPPTYAPQPAYGGYGGYAPPPEQHLYQQTAPYGAQAGYGAPQHQQQQQQPYYGAAGAPPPYAYGSGRPMQRFAGGHGAWGAQPPPAPAPQQYPQGQGYQDRNANPYAALQRRR